MGSIVKASFLESRRDIVVPEHVARSVEYVPRWSSSSKEHRNPYHDNKANDEFDCESESFFGDLPVFADEGNKLLHEETKVVESRLKAAEKEMKDEHSRVAIMAQHLKYVQQEMEHTNSFLAAKIKEISTEEHLSTLSFRERGRCQHEIARCRATLENERGRFKILQKQVFGAKKDIETFKTSMNWNQEELEQWAAATAQKDDDYFALQKYARADEVKTKELALVLENLASMAAQRRAELDNEVTETNAQQVELERTALFFKSRHSERNLLVMQWRNTIEAMRQRDEEINGVSREFVQPSTLKETQLNDLKVRRIKVELIESDNSELQRDIDDTERLNQSKKQEHISMRSAQQSFKDELESLQYENEATVSSLLKRRTECQVASNSYYEMTSQLDHYQQRCQDIKRHLEDVKKITVAKETDAKDVEKFVSDHTKELIEAEKYLEKFKHQIFRESQLVIELRHGETNLMAEIRSAYSVAKNLTTKIHSLEGNLLRQRELLYNAEFQHHFMERKVARGLGERSDEEKLSLQSSIDDLEGNLASTMDKKVDLVQRCRRLRNELRAWVRQREQRQQDEIHVLKSINEVELDISACEISIKSQVATKEELMVSNDMMRLELGRLRNKLTHGTEEVYNIENQHRQLEIVVTQKKNELLVQSEIKSAQIRAAEEDRHKAAVELGKRKVGIEKLQSKYDMITKTLHQDNEVGWSKNSQVFHLIVAAQKREELLQEGDELDEEIQQKEKELQAMEKSLEHIREMNSEYRLSFSKVDMKGERAKELCGLESKLVDARKTLVEQRESFYHGRLELFHISSQFDCLRHATVSLQDCQ